MSHSLTIVICTKDRAASLDRCLSALGRVKPPADGALNLILVDNASADETRAVFERHRLRLPFDARYIRESRAGIGHAMNAGYRAARGEIVAFTDDDCYPDETFAEAVIDAFADPAVGVAAGRILLHDPSDLRITIEESTEPRRFPAGSYLRPGQFAGANLAFRRRALDAIGGFDPLFGPGSYIGSAADLDAAGRVCLAGWDAVYEPRIVVSHHHGRKDGDRPEIERRYAIGAGGYHMKLLMRERRARIFLRYAAGLARRALVNPGIARWELHGAIRYLRQPTNEAPSHANARTVGRMASPSLRAEPAKLPVERARRR